MTKREARRIVWHALATTLDNDLDHSGAGWIYDARDAAKVEAEARAVLEILERRGARQ